MSKHLAITAVAAFALFAACSDNSGGPGSGPGTGGTSGTGAGGAVGGGAGTALGGSAGTLTGGAGGAGASDAAAGGSAGATVACDLGTMYPNEPLIDPDNPVYQDATWTQQAVTQAFAQAKAENSLAYQGYRAARDYEKYMECPFCACGCEELIGHLSAIDCFKDMHGFA